MTQVKYPELAKLFGENFTLICETLKECFPDLFDFTALEKEEKLKNALKSNYFLFFMHATQGLNLLATSSEIINKVYKNILLKTIETPNPNDNKYSLYHKVNYQFCYGFLIKRGDAGKPHPHQIGYFEKLAAGTLKRIEPLTYMDMWRGCYDWLDHGCKIYHLFNLGHIDGETLRQQKTLIINFNQNPSQTPKWGIVDLSQKHVFCEAILTNSERQQLEEKLNIGQLNYEGGISDSSASSGYLVIAKLHKQDSSSKSDFYVLRHKVLGFLMQSSSMTHDEYRTCKRINIGFNLFYNHDENYCSEEFKYHLAETRQSLGKDLPRIRNALNEHTSATHPEVTELYNVNTLSQLSRGCQTGIIDKKSFELNNMAALLKTCYQHNIKYHHLYNSRLTAIRNDIPGLPKTLTEYGCIQEDPEETGVATLTVTNNLDIDKLIIFHKSSAARSRLNGDLIECAKRIPDDRSIELEEFIATMILNFFRSRAKKPNIAINVPAYISGLLLDTEIQSIVNLVEDNPYIQTLDVTDNPTLIKLKQHLTPLIARNRLLRLCGYRPPLAADFGEIAADYWFKYLCQHPDLLQDDKHVIFKSCLADMGLKGLNYFLNYLMAQRKLIARMLIETTYPPFTALCISHELPSYLIRLNDYLQDPANYFPFSEVELQFQKDSIEILIALMKTTIQRGQIEKITLRNCLKNKTELGIFLNEVLRAALKEHWEILLIIPELEVPDITDDKYTELRRVYTQLNNIILKNRRFSKEEAISKQIAERLAALSIEPLETAPRKKPESEAKKTMPGSTLKVDALALKNDDSWPLARQGSVQLQLQQQQEIQLTHQVQYKFAESQEHGQNDKLTLHTVNYHTIEEVLGEYYKREYQAPLNQNYAPLLTAGETPLQQLFHNWINANPQVKAKHVIHAMTIEAVKKLLQHQRHLSSGLNLRNLPRGFLTQRDHEGNLILCYDPAVMNVYSNSPLTLDLKANEPRAENWLGDFRQLENKPAKLINNVFGLKEATHLIAFNLLSPSPAATEGTLEILIAKNPNDSEKIKKYFSLFKQAYELAGETAVTFLLELPEDNLNLSTYDVLDLLLHHYEWQEVVDWVKSLDITGEKLRKLGQIYYAFDAKGLYKLLKQLKQLDDLLGRNFYILFEQSFFDTCENPAVLYSPASFEAMQEMCNCLSNSDALKHLWQKFIVLHIGLLGFETPEKLWHAFVYFNSRITQEGLTLDTGIFDKLKAQNMLVLMDRILACLDVLDNLEQKKQFLENLHLMDLAHGGVPYALQYEQFKNFDATLKLSNFEAGMPTYSVNLADIFNWPTKNTSLFFNRLFASLPEFSLEEYYVLCEQFATLKKGKAQETVIYLLLTRHQKTEYQSLESLISGIRKRSQTDIAKHLHGAVYTHKNTEITVDLESVFKLQAFLSKLKHSITPLLKKFPRGTLLEAVSIANLIHKAEDFSHIIMLFTNAPAPQNYFETETYKLAVLFNVFNQKEINALILALKNLKARAQIEIRLLILQLLAIDPEKPGNLTALNEAWGTLIDTIKTINEDIQNSATIRKAFISALTKEGVNFKFTLNGSHCTIEDKIENKPAALSKFLNCENRLWQFICHHIAIPYDAHLDARRIQKHLQPLMNFLEQILTKNSYLNEIEPLLAILSEAPKDHYWDVNYLCQLLSAFKSQNEAHPYPVTILKAILEETLVTAKSLETVETIFPYALKNTFAMIMQNNVLTHDIQAKFCQIAIKEFTDTRSTEFTNTLITTFLTENYDDEIRRYAIPLLARCDNFDAIQTQWAQCEQLLKASIENLDIKQPDWFKACAYWLESLNKERDIVIRLFDKIQSLDNCSPEKCTLLFYIIAWSSLHKGLKDDELYKTVLTRKALKLIHELQKMSEEDLIIIASAYPQEPCPDANDILQLIKYKNAEGGRDWPACLDHFSKNAHRLTPTDFGQLTYSRENDFKRILQETTIISGENEQGLNEELAITLSRHFSHLKALEDGDLVINQDILSIDRFKKLRDYTQEKLRQAFKQLTLENSNDERLTVQLWAILFEVLGRTTKKYPHLAQQFASIANDICLESASRILKLATGEGKSHFCVLRAAFHVARGKKVDICTAKRSLAERDFAEYQAFFDYLGIKSTYIHAESKASEYTDAAVCFTTIGDLSLFIDRLSYEGTPIDRNQANTIGLLDECDFTRFEEDKKTQYNSAIPTGLTPKQRTWFYETVNAFYQENISELTQEHLIRYDTLMKFVSKLNENADDAEKQQQVQQLLDEPEQLIQWLQSAHDAHRLEEGAGFSLVSGELCLGGGIYPMLEIVPLSIDNQKVVGSTFSAGVQQLLATRLNNERIANGLYANIHVPHESYILSSQIASKRIKELWSSWEGLTATLSSQQAAFLYDNEGIQVLEVPTNQLCLRKWEAAGFYDDETARLSAIVEQALSCFERKHSILFACKNDKMVTELKSALKTRLTPEQFSQFIFYTNDQTETAPQILERKALMEQSFNGTRQQGVALVASGFGRGDNVDVEADFILYANDSNDLIQKGGRTGRNGKAGTVYQFYLRSELIEADENLKKELSILLNDTTKLEQILTKFNSGHSDNDLLERVMQLREYIFTLQNEAEHTYHALIAQYSSWGLDIVSKLHNKDEKTQKTTQQRWAESLASVEKEWLKLSSCRYTSSIADKKRRIREEILKDAANFLKLCNGVNTLASFEFSVEENNENNQNNNERTPALTETTLRKCIAHISRKSSLLNNTIQSAVLSSEDIHPLENIANRYVKINPLLEMTELKSIFDKHQALLEQSLPQYEKMAKTCENPEWQAELLSSYCNLAAVFQDQAELFHFIVTKTSYWWNQGLHTSYQADLLALWQKLIQLKVLDADYIALINQCLTYPGKTWFQRLNIFLAIEDLPLHFAKIMDKMVYLDSIPYLTKQERTILLEKYVAVINLDTQDDNPVKRIFESAFNSDNYHKKNKFIKARNMLSKLSVIHQICNDDNIAKDIFEFLLSERPYFIGKLFPGSLYRLNDKAFEHWLQCLYKGLGKTKSHAAFLDISKTFILTLNNDKNIANNEELAISCITWFFDFITKNPLTTPALGKIFTDNDIDLNISALALHLNPTDALNEELYLALLNQALSTKYEITKKSDKTNGYTPLDKKFKGNKFNENSLQEWIENLNAFTQLLHQLKVNEDSVQYQSLLRYLNQYDTYINVHDITELRINESMKKEFLGFLVKEEHHEIIIRYPAIIPILFEYASDHPSQPISFAKMLISRLSENKIKGEEIDDVSKKIIVFIQKSTDDTIEMIIELIKQSNELCPFNLDLLLLLFKHNNFPNASSEKSHLQQTYIKLTLIFQDVILEKGNSIIDNILKLECPSAEESSFLCEFIAKGDLEKNLLLLVKLYEQEKFKELSNSPKKRINLINILFQYISLFENEDPENIIVNILPFAICEIAEINLMSNYIRSNSSVIKHFSKFYQAKNIDKTSETQRLKLLDILLNNTNNLTSEHAENWVSNISRLLAIEGLDVDFLIEKLAEDPAFFISNAIVGYLYNTATTSSDDIVAACKNLTRDTSEIERLINFDETTQENRIHVMKILTQEILVDQYPTHQNHFDRNKNNSALTFAYQQYIKRTKEILKNNNANLELEIPYQLSSIDHTALLNLAGEMSQIIQDVPRNEIQQSRRTLIKNQLESYLNEYDAAWFKSFDRKKQKDTLKQRLFDNDKVSNNNYYKDIFDILQSAKSSAMEKDNEINRARTGFFSRPYVNRSGYSRFYNTINKMEELIIANWATDPEAIRSFAQYINLAKNNVNHLIDQLDTELNNIPESVALHLSNLKIAVTNAKGTISEVTLTALITELKKEQPLPGHTKTLLNDLRMPAIALRNHLCNPKNLTHHRRN